MSSQLKYQIDSKLQLPANQYGRLNFFNVIKHYLDYFKDYFNNVWNQYIIVYRKW